MTRQQEIERNLQRELERQAAATAPHDEPRDETHVEPHDETPPATIAEVLDELTVAQPELGVAAPEPREPSAPPVASIAQGDDQGNRKRRSRLMIDMINSAPPVTTGRAIRNFPLLTEVIGGLRGITILGGPTGHAKSRLAGNIVAGVGGPDLPVLYLDLENDDQVDENGEPVTRTVGDWIAEAYSLGCPALKTLHGCHSFDVLKEDVPTFAPPALIVIDTIQSVVGQSGDRMRVDMVGLVEWAKAQVRRGYLVMLISQVNGIGEFKESQAIKEGGWVNLTVQKTGATVEVRASKVRRQALVTKGVVLRLDGAKLTEVRAIGATVKTESGQKLTPLQQAVVKLGGRVGFEALMKARGYSLKRDTASRKAGLREIAAAVEACEIGHPSRNVYTFPATTTAATATTSS